MMKARIAVVLAESVGTVNRNIFGHFAEHLGRCVYEGIWVGEDSAIPNVRGIRADVVQALRRLDPPVLRWPGGCFADDYHWRDGIGPRDTRPRRFNIHWGNAPEHNHFGTHEFIDLCREIGAEPYICLNLGSGSPREAREWVEYCNGVGDSTLVEERRKNGSPEPFNVRYWGVGNELWGCGGHLQPAAYAAEVKRYLTFLNHFGIFKIACGPRGTNPFDLRRDWTLDFFREYAKVQHPSQRPVDGFALHFYTRSPEAGGDLGFSPAEYYWSVQDTVRMEGLIREVRAGMDAYDPGRGIALVIDEWGTWHPQARGDTGLEQQNTMRDALVAALNLDIFVRNADVVAMANIAQTVNVLQAMILTKGERMIVTPSYHVFEMYRHHQAGEVRADPGRLADVRLGSPCRSARRGRIGVPEGRPAVPHPHQCAHRPGSGRGGRAPGRRPPLRAASGRTAARRRGCPRPQQLRPPGDASGRSTFRCPGKEVIGPYCAFPRTPFRR